VSQQNQSYYTLVLEKKAAIYKKMFESHTPLYLIPDKKNNKILLFFQNVHCKKVKKSV